MLVHKSILPLVLLVAISVSIIALTPAIPKVHAVAPTTLSIQPPSQGLAATGSTVTYTVNVINIPSTGGFNIYVQTSYNILSPTAITLSSFLPSGFENAHCINNVGTACDVHDGPGIAHEAFASLGLNSGNGTLFTITYTAVNGPGSRVAFPGVAALSVETVTSNNGLNSIFDANGFNITGVPENSGVYGTVASPYFTITTSATFPSTILATNSATSTVTVASVNGFAGSVSLAPNPSSGLVCNAVTPVNLVSGGTAQSSLTCKAAIGGEYPATVTGTGGTPTITFTSTPPAIFHVVDFSIAGPGITTLATFVGNSTLAVTPINAFTGSVSFTAGMVPSGCTASFSGPVLSVQCATGVAPFNVPVTGTTGTAPNTLSRTTSVPVAIQDFLVSCPGITTLATVTGNSTCAIVPINGFAGTVTLTAGAVPSGCTASFTGKVLSVNCATAVAPFSVPVTGTTGMAPNTLSRSTTDSVTIQDFSIAGPAITTLATVAGSSTMAVTPVNGFTRTVTFVVTAGFIFPSGCSGSFSGPVLSVTCSTGVAPFNVPVTGSSGGLSRSTSVLVTTQDFSVSASPASLTVVVGTPQTSTLSFTSINGFSGAVSFSTSVAPTGCTASVSGTVLTVSCTAVPSPTSFTLTVTGTTGSAPNTLTRTMNVPVSVSPAPTFGVSLGAVTPAGILATNSGTSTVTVTSLNGFAGTVSLSTSPSTGLLCNPVASVTLTAGGTANSALTCNAATGADYAASVTGSGGSPAQNIPSNSVTFHVVDFSIAGPGITALATFAGTSTVTVTPINGFSGTVTLVAGAVPSGCTASFTGSVLSVNCATGVAPFSVPVTGTTGTAPNTLSRTTSVSVTVQDFSVSANPSSLSVTVGTPKTSALSFTTINGFSGTVSFSTSAAPTGCTASVSGTVLTVSCTSVPSPATFTLTITGTTGSAPNTLSRSTTVSVAVNGAPTFTVSLGPVSPTSILATNSGTSTVTVTSVNGFVGAVSLAANPSTGLVCNAVTGVTLTAGGSATAALTCSAATGADYTVTVTGSGGSPVQNIQSNSVTFHVVDFSIAGPAISTLATIAGTSTVVVTPVNGFSGAVTFAAGAVPAGCSASFSSAVLSVTCATGVAPFSVPVTGTTGTAPNTLSRTTSVSVTIRDFSISGPATTTLATVAGTSTVVVTPVNGFSGAVTFTAGAVPTGCTASFAGAVLSVTCSTGVAPFSVPVTGTTGTAPNTLSRTTSVSVTVQDFSVAGPAITTLATIAGTSAVAVTPINGFLGSVTFAVSAGFVFPSGCSGSFTGAVLSVTCATGVAPFSVPVTGTTGTAPNTLSRTTSVSVTIRDFSIAGPAITTLATFAGSSTVAVTPINAFAGSVTFAAGAVPSGCIASFSGSVLSVTCAAGVALFTVPVTGTTGTAPNTLSRTTSVSVTVQDFSVSASPASITIVVGTPQTSTLSFTSINLFSGTVTYSTSAAPTSCTAGASGTVLTVSCTAVPTPATFTLTVTGTTGTAPNTLSRTTTVSVAVNGAPTFTVSLGAVTPTSILATNSGTSTVTVVSVNSFAGAVSLTANPSTGLVCNAITGVTLTAGGSATSALTCNAATGADYTITVTGSGGSPVQNIQSNSITFHVVDFSVAGPQITTLATVGGISTVAVTPINAFSGGVTFVAGAVPSGCTTSFTGAVLSVTCATGVAPFSVPVTGTTGTAPNTLSRTTTVSVTVQDFSIAGPAITTLATVVGSSTVSVTPINAFAGTVTFAAGAVPAGCTASFSGAVLSVTCATGVASFTVPVTGTTGGAPNTLSRSTTVSVTIQDFSIAGPAITMLATFAGSSTVSVTPINAFAGTVTFAAGAVPSGCTASFTGAVLSVTCSAGIAPFSVPVTGTSGGLSRSTTVSVTVQDFSVACGSITTLATVAGTSNCVVTPVNAFAGTVTFVAGAVPSGCTTSFTGAVLSVTCPTGGAPFTVPVTGTTGTAPNTLSRFASASVTVQDFSIAGPGITPLATIAGTSTVAVTPINGFTGTVTFAITSGFVFPSGCSGSFAGAILSVTCATGVAGFVVPVTGTSGSLSRSTSVAVTVQDFSISGPSITALATVAGTSTVAVTPINGFSGTVTFAAGAVPSGCTASFTGAVLSVTCATGVASFTVPVTGTTGTAPNTLSRTTSVSVTVQDFSIAGPAISTLATIAGTSTVVVTPINAFSGTVTFTAGTVPSGCTASFTGAVLSVTCATGVAPFSVPVTGTTGTAPNTLSRTTSVSVTIRDFSVSASPSSLTVVVGTPQTSTLSFTAINGFSGTVTFSTSAAPTGCTASVSGTVLTVSCTAAPSPNPFALTVTGTTGTAPNTLARTTSVSVAVSGAATFTVSLGTVTPASVLATNSGSSTITVTSVNGFAGAVSLAANPSTGLVCNAVAGVTLTAGGSATSALTCSAATGADYTVTVTGTGGTPTQTRPSGPVTFHAVDFSIAGPAITTLATVVGSSIVAVTPVNGFSGTVTFAVSAGFVFPSGCSGSFTGAVLSVTCSTGIAPFTVPVTGTTGTAPNTLSRTTSVSVTIRDFFIAGPAITTLATVAGSSTVAVTPINAFAGSVTFAAGAVPAGCTASFSSAVLSVTCATGVAPFTVPVTGTTGTAPNTLSRSTTISVTVQDLSLSASPSSLIVVVPIVGSGSNSSTISFTPINAFSGAVSFSTSAAPTGCTASVSGTVLTVSCTAVPSPASFTLTITGTTGTAPNTLSRTVSIPVTVRGTPTFTVSLGAVAPSSILATNSGTSTVTVTSVNSFAGAVSLTANPSTGLVCNAITGVTLTAGGSATSALTCNAATGADYTVTVTGSGGSPVQNKQSISVTFHVIDFSVSANPSSLNVVVPIVGSGSNSSTISFTAINGFSGTVTFSTSAAPTGCTASVSGTVLTVSCTAVPSSATFTLTITGATGTAPNTLSRIGTLSISVSIAKDFTVTSSRSTIGPLVTAWQEANGTPHASLTGQTRITVRALNGFTGIVTLSMSATAGLNAVLNTTTITFTAGGFTVINATLTVDSTAAANYTVTVTGSSAGLTPKSASPVAVTVVDFGVVSDPSIGPLIPASGQTGTSRITVTSVNSIVALVKFTLDASGLQNSVTPASCTLNTTIVSCAGIYTVTAPDFHGPYIVFPHATSFVAVNRGDLGTNPVIVDRSTTVTVHVPDFGLRTGVGPDTIGPIVPGPTGATTSVIVQAFDGFVGTVTFTPVAAPGSGLSDPVHISTASSPISYTFISGGPALISDTLSVSTNQLGTYSVIVTGTSAGYPDHIIRVFVLAPPELIIVPQSIGTAVAGSIVNYSVNAVDLPLYGGYDISVQTNSTVLIPDSIDVSATAIPSLFEVVNCVNGGFYANGTAIPLNLPGNLNCGPSDGPGIAHSSGISATGGSTAGDGLLFMIHYKAQASDFTMNANPSVIIGPTGNSTVTVTTVSLTNLVIFNDSVFASDGVSLVPHSTRTGLYGGFNVTLTLASSPGLTANISPATMTFDVLHPSATALLTLGASTAGTYTVIINGTAVGFASHTVSVTVIVPASLAISASPSSIFIQLDSSASSTITVTSQGSFAGTVCLTASGATVLSPTITPACVTLAAGGTAQATLTVAAVAGQTPSGTYTITVTGTSGSTSVNTKITVSVLSDLIRFKSFTWLSSVSVTTNGGVETWSAQVSSHASTTQYVQLSISGGTSSGTRTFFTLSGIVAVAPGAHKIKITATNTFTSADIGNSFRFTALIQFGSSPTSLNLISSAVKSGTFTVTT